METMAEYLAELVKAGLGNRKAAPLPEGISVEDVAKISGENHMDYLLLGALLRTEGLSEEEKELLREKVRGSMLFTGVQLQELKMLEQRMEEAKIPCQPMKGARMKFYYPSPFLREMSDIDILIHGDFMEQAAAELERMGYVLEQKIKHHDIYRKAPGIVVEAHRAMYDRTVDERQYAYFSDLSRAVRRKGFLYVYDFEAEDFYIYMMAHMAKHFYKRGCGIRNLVDIYVFRERFGPEMNDGYLEKQFANLGLAAFVEHMERLTDIWLNGEPWEEFYRELFDYMQGCGIYGKDENGIWNCFCDAGMEAGGKGHGALKRWYWFPPYEYMVLYYPWISKNPVTGRLLLPAAWGLRAVRGVVCGRGRHKREMLRQIDAAQISVRQDIYRRLQLRFH